MDNGSGSGLENNDSSEWLCSNNQLQFHREIAENGDVDYNLDIANNYRIIAIYFDNELVEQYFQNTESWDLYELNLHNPNWGDFPFNNVIVNDHFNGVSYKYKYNELKYDDHNEYRGRRYQSTAYSVCKQEVEYDPNGFPYM